MTDDKDKPNKKQMGDSSMKENKKLLILVTVLCACLIIVCFSASGHSVTYEIRPEVDAAEYRTDKDRAIDAYEHLMDRFMDLTERNFIGVNRNVKGLAKKLSSVDAKLTDIALRIARIEGALGIKQPEKLVKDESKSEICRHVKEKDLKKQKSCGEN